MYINSHYLLDSMIGFQIRMESFTPPYSQNSDDVRTGACVSGRPIIFSVLDDGSLLVYRCVLSFNACMLDCAGPAVVASCHCLFTILFFHLGCQCGNWECCSVWKVLKFKNPLQRPVKYDEDVVLLCILCNCSAS